MRKTIHTSEYQALLAWLKQMRIERGITMEMAARRVGKTSSWVAKTEMGDRRLDIVEYVRYCDALGISPAKGMKIIQATIRQISANL